MKDFDKILEKLNNNIDALEAETNDVLQKAEKAIKLIKTLLEELRGLVAHNDFETEEAEINFFKATKPLVFSKLIYYVKFFNIESENQRVSMLYIMRIDY